MNQISRIVFPMRIEADDLFNVIHEQAKRWRAELDNTNTSRAIFKVSQKLPGMIQPRAATATSGRHVNTLA